MSKLKPLADPRRRLYAPSLRAPVQDPAHVDVDLGAFVERLLLFDTYVFHSQNLFELPALADRFGVQALIRLFKSDAVELSVDKASFGVFRPTDRPADPYALHVDAFRYQQPQSFNKDVQLLRESYEIRRLSDWRSLTSALRASVERRPVSFADLAAADRHTSHDFTLAATTPGRIGPFVRAALQRNASRADWPYRFDVHADGRAFHVDTDIESVYGLDTETAGQVVQDALLALASEVHRVSEMRLFRALTPFSESDASLYAAHLDYLVRQVNPATPSDALSRVVTLEGLPNLRAPGVAEGVNLHAVLDARNSPEGRAFRDWLWTAADLTDDEVEEQLAYHVDSIGRRFAFLLKTPRSRRLRWVAASGVGLAAAAGASAVAASAPAIAAVATVAGTAAGLATSYADGFLLDRILPDDSQRSSPAAFVARRYPSLFTTT